MAMPLLSLPPKESGNWMDTVFDWCVDLLLSGAAMLGISYNEINVWIFCVIWPLLTLILIGLVLYQRAHIRRLKRKLDSMHGTTSGASNPRSG